MSKAEAAFVSNPATPGNNTAAAGAGAIALIVPSTSVNNPRGRAPRAARRCVCAWALNQGSWLYISGIETLSAIEPLPGSRNRRLILPRLPGDIAQLLVDP